MSASTPLGLCGVRKAPEPECPAPVKALPGEPHPPPKKKRGAGPAGAPGSILDFFRPAALPREFGEEHEFVGRIQVKPRVPLLIVAGCGMGKSTSIHDWLEGRFSKGEASIVLRCLIRD